MRFGIALTTTVVAMVAALAVAVGAGAGVAGAATGTASNTPGWSTLQSYSSATIGGSSPSGTIALVSSIACPSYGQCVAAGFEASASGSENSAVMIENGAAQWGQPIAAPLPANAATGTSTAILTSVACSSATSCVAVGSYPSSANGSQPFAVSFTVSGSAVSFGTPEQVSLPSNALTTSSQGAFLSGVSCGTGGCVAVGTYETNAGTPVWTAITATQGASGTWTATAASAPTGASNDILLNAISCPSTGACEAVGTYADSTNHLQLWTVQVAGGATGTAQPVTIPNAAAQDDSAPSASSFPTPRAGLTAVSCPSAGVCTAAGTADLAADLPAAVLLPITAGVPGQTSTLSSGGSIAFTELEAIWCSDASDCMVAGLEAGGVIGEPMAASETGGSWSAPVLIQSGSTAGGFVNTAVATTVACSSPGVCVTGGLNITETLTTPPTETEGSFFAYSALPPTITTTSLPPASVGKPYTATLQSSGGLGTASWAVTVGSLPAGLTLNAATGVISGTPNAAGQNGLVVTTTNAGPPSLSSTASLSLTVGPAATVAIAYSKISGHSALIVFSCGGAPCVGKYKLTGVEHLHGKTPTAVDAKAKKQPKKRTVTLASGRYSIRAGAAKPISIKLNAKGVKLLRELHKINAQLTLTPTGATKPALIKTLKFR
jgi:hypothetical protein